MLADHFRQMSCNDGRWIDYRITKAFRTLPLSFCDPDSRQMEGRFKCLDTCDLFLYITGIHCHIMIKQNLSLTDLDSFDLDNILIRIQLDIVTQSDDRNDRT